MLPSGSMMMNSRIAAETNSMMARPTWASFVEQPSSCCQRSCCSPRLRFRRNWLLPSRHRKPFEAFAFVRSRSRRDRCFSIKLSIRAIRSAPTSRPIPTHIRLSISGAISRTKPNPSIMRPEFSFSKRPCAFLHVVDRFRISSSQSVTQLREIQNLAPQRKHI